MNTSRRNRTVLLTALPVAAVAALVFWPRPPDLAPYTSPTVVLNGKPLHVEALVPAGWKVEMLASNTEIWTAGGKHKTTLIMLVPGSDRRLAWAPQWVRRMLFRAPPAHGDVIMISVGVTPSRLMPGAKAGAISILDVPKMKSAGRPKMRCAWRAIDTPPGAAISYMRSDRVEFERTYHAVCESLKVIQ